MKRIFPILNLLIILAEVTFINSVIAQTPTYILTAKNFTTGNPSDSILEWDVYIEHTNSPTQFEYSGGQYFFAFNPDIANGGNLTYSIVDSDLPVNMRPRSPSISTASNPTQVVLRLAINSLPGAGNGYIMTNNGYPGTKILRLRLATSASELNCQAMLQITWRNPPIVSFVTRIFAYIGTVITEITTPNTHHVDSSSGTIHGWCGPGSEFYVYFDIEGMLNTATNKFFRADTIEVQSRSNVSPYNILKKNKVFTDSGLVSVRVDLFSDSYYVVKYRNAIETWSAFSLYFMPPYYYFTDSAASAYGSNQVLVGSRYCIYSGDVNQDGIIEGTDISRIDNDAYNFVSGSFLSTDLNGDDIVDGNDFAICENNAFKFVSVISPQSDKHIP